MALLPVANMHIYIGAVLEPTSADCVAGDFTAANASPDSWINIDGWVNMGPVGDAVNLITTALINRGRDTHQKGTASAPTMSNTFTIIAADAGQTALRVAAAASNKANYSFKIVGNEPSPIVNPSIIYFSGLVMGAPEQGGGANTIRTLNANIQVNSNVVFVAAS